MPRCDSNIVEIEWKENGRLQLFFSASIFLHTANLIMLSIAIFIVLTRVLPSEFPYKLLCFNWLQQDYHKYLFFGVWNNVYISWPKSAYSEYSLQH
jgi:hypothetical protein